MSQNQIIADTGFWVALANNKDKHHSLSKKVLSTLLLKINYQLFCDGGNLSFIVARNWRRSAN
jgi:predicted nucleic acid-binding protein